MFKTGLMVTSRPEENLPKGPYKIEVEWMKVLVRVKG